MPQHMPLSEVRQLWSLVCGDRGAQKAPKPCYVTVYPNLYGGGGAGLAVTRDTGTGESRILERVPRNAQPVFNLGDESFHTLFHDGRVTARNADAYPSGCITHAGWELLGQRLREIPAYVALFEAAFNDVQAGNRGN